MPFFDLPLDQLWEYRPDVSEPADFDEFWSATLDEHPWRPDGMALVDVDTGLRDVRVQDLTFPGFDGAPIAAWVISPTAAGPHPAVVHYVGYGGGRGLPEEHLVWAGAGFVQVVMDTRGQGAGWGTGGATADTGHAGGPAAPGFMTRGIEEPRDYYYRRLYVDAHHAVEAAAALEQVDPTRVAATGGSQGGALAIAAASLNPRVAALMADVPFLCHFERALGLTGRDPYEEIVRYLAVHRDKEEQAYSTLSYFDNVNLGKRATAPALFSTALMDAVCPPSTVFAMRNHYGGPSEIEVYRFNGHEGGATYQLRKQLAWLKELSAASS